MKYTQLFCKTLKESPKDAVLTSHQLMIRAGLIKKVSAGIYSILPLGQMVFEKLKTIIREELTKIGAQEITMPIVIPASQWQASGRWDKYGPELLRIKDRQANDFCLGPTHEETVVDLVKNDVKSYKELPLCLYQIQTKFRDEIRPRFGLMRAREFVMKDAYSFHETPADLNDYFLKMKQAYQTIFNRCGLDVATIQADSGNIGGEGSMEFMVLADQGEDTIVTCSKTGKSANIEAWACDPVPEKNNQNSKSPIEKIKTPNQKTIEEVAQFLKVNPSQCIKALLYQTDEEPVMVLLRGDHQLNECKAKRELKTLELTPINEKRIKEEFNLYPGFLGPLNIKDIKIIADAAIQTMNDAVIGANEEGAHIKNVAVVRDIDCEFFDLRLPVEGEPSPFDKEGVVEYKRGIEVGHIFKLQDTYSKAMKANFLNKQGKEQPFLMGCYGVGVGRTIAAAIEQYADSKGIVWPKSLAPFLVSIIVTNSKDETLRSCGQNVYKQLNEAKMSCLLDDREISTGIKFKDADLLGFPYQIVIGKSWLNQEDLEIVERKTGDKKTIKLSQLVSYLNENID